MPAKRSAGFPRISRGPSPHSSVGSSLGCSAGQCAPRTASARSVHLEGPMPLRNGNGPSFRAYRAYRMPHRRGRMSRRPGAAPQVGATRGGVTAILITFGIFAGSAAAAFFGYFAADLPAAHELATVPVPLSTFIYDRTGEHLLYTLEDQRRELVTLPEVPLLMQDATIAIEDHS